MEEWRIARDRARCEQPACPLGPSSEYFAVLELPACTRRDLCERCFRELENGSAEAPLFWRGRRRAAQQRGPVLDLPSLRHLFDRLGEPQDPERAEVARALRYLVALLLLRKRWLKLVDAQTEVQEAADLLVVDPKIEAMEPVALHAPPLDAAGLGALKGELLAVLDEG